MKEPKQVRKIRVCVKACGFDKNSTDFEVGKIEVVRKI